MAIEIVDLPINSMVIFHSYVSLPEGIVVCFNDQVISIAHVDHSCNLLKKWQAV